MSLLEQRVLVRKQNPEEYHLRELEIARDPSRPEHVMPPFVPSPARILDIGCGAGQTLIAAFPDRVSFGVDLDVDALKLGAQLTKRVRFAVGLAEALPYRNEAFEMVIARVSLPYTFLAESLNEIRRVLKPNGVVWAALHPFLIPWAQARRSGIRAKFRFLYVLTNSLLFHWFQKQFALAGRCESFQTSRGIRRVLTRCGFDHIEIDLNGGHFLVMARKASAGHPSIPCLYTDGVD
jgi:SAM-dependent methyltransferase